VRLKSQTKQAKPHVVQKSIPVLKKGKKTTTTAHFPLEGFNAINWNQVRENNANIIRKSEQRKDIENSF